MELLWIVVASWAAGAASWAGGLIARHESSRETPRKRQLIHAVVAFGGGVLVAAVAFALTPQGIEHLNSVLLTVLFCAGGVVFFLIDAWLEKRGGAGAQLMAMLMDFIPEALSMGAVFSSDRRLGMLLAVFIGIQNLPEGFNSYRELVSMRLRGVVAIRALALTSLLGPIAACGGYFLLRDMPSLTAGIMTFASGGILYLVFQDIAPQSTMRRHWSPPLGAVLGFAVGMLGEKLLS